MSLGSGRPMPLSGRFAPERWAPARWTPSKKVVRSPVQVRSGEVQGSGEDTLRRGIQAAAPLGPLKGRASRASMRFAPD